MTYEALTTENIDCIDSELVQEEIQEETITALEELFLDCFSL